MNIVTTLKQKTGYIVASAALVLGVIAPGLVSVYVSAAQLTTRSIELSSSSVSATGTIYNVAFTAPSGASAFTLTFCDNSADPDAACTPPTGFSAAGAGTTSTTDYTVTGATNKVTVESTVTTGEEVEVDITGITNPSEAGPLYVRIATFANTTDAGTGNNVIDNGSVVVGITNTIGVSGAVLETLTFCVTKVVIEEDCANANDPESLPTLEIGEGTGSVKALEPGAISTGTLYTQLSTNAATGAIINMKSSSPCGGLKRASVSTCDIAPALKDGITEGQAKFGVLASASTATTGVTNAGGILRPFPGSGYNPTAYVFNYVANNSTGVTSTFGDPFLDTNGEPVNNQNVQLTFGASVSNSTPAGAYSTSLSMIATGKF